MFKHEHKLCQNNKFSVLKPKSHFTIKLMLQKILTIEDLYFIKKNSKKFNLFSNQTIMVGYREMTNTILNGLKGISYQIMSVILYIIL